MEKPEPCYIAYEGINGNHFELFLKKQNINLHMTWQFCYQLGFLTSLINRNWSEARQEIWTRFTGAPATAGGSEQTAGSSAQEIPKVREGKHAPYMGWG